MNLDQLQNFPLYLQKWPNNSLLMTKDSLIACELHKQLNMFTTTEEAVIQKIAL